MAVNSVTLTGGTQNQYPPAQTAEKKNMPETQRTDTAGGGGNVAGAGAPVNRGAESTKNAQETNTQGPGKANSGGYGGNTGTKVNVTA